MSLTKNLKSDSNMESKSINHKQKLTKGGFEMKPTRFLIVALVLMGLVATASAITEEGTIISNQAIGNYEDANGNPMAQVQSLVVQTTVSQIAGVGLGADQAQSIQSMASYLYPVTVDNSGNGDDFFTLVATGAVVPSGGTYNVEIYHDVNGTGTIVPGDGDAIVSQTSSLTYTETYNLLIKVTDVDGGAGGDEHTVTLIATSDFNIASKDTILLVTTIQAAAVNGTTDIIGNPTPEAGESVTFESCFTNDGSATAYNPIFRTVMPTNTTLDVNSVSIDGGNNFLTIATSAPYGDYHFRGDTLELFLGDLVSAATICVQFDAVLDGGLTPVDVVSFPANNPSFTYENEGGTEYPVENPDPTGDFDGNIEVEQTYAVSLVAGGVNGPAYTGDPGDTLVYDFTVTNDGNGNDAFNFSDTTDYVTWVYYVDGNGDGSLSPSEKAVGAITFTATLTAGQSEDYIAIGTIPVPTADTAADASIIVATSQGLASVSDSATNSTTCTAPVLSLLKSVTHDGTEYFSGDANSAAPGDTLTYTIVVTNSGTGIATNVVVSDALDLVNTAYVLDTMTIDGTGDPTVDDDDDADGAAFTGSSVVWTFSSMDADGGAADEHTLTFQVTIK